MLHLRLRALGALLVAAAVTSACAPSRSADPTAVNVQVAPPMRDLSNAYESANLVQLPEQSPEDYDDLHNVYRLSDRIISGSEPATEEALARLASWGVKTILSTDGKAPDAALAAKYGMRYVHVPIQYKGITPEEQVRIIKTFRECEGPFFVHCFHGRHRGPAAAALGRLVLDGVSREQALAEMRQWCGTSSKYSGLYWTIASAEIPSAEESRAVEWDFPSAQPLDGVAGAMVPVARHYENVYYASDVDYGVDPLHPDIDPLNEAQILLQLYEQLVEMDEVKQSPEDYRRWMDDSVVAARDLVAALRELRAEEEGALGRVESALTAVKRACDACHASYRNR